jgi:hypothetical protein
MKGLSQKYNLELLKSYTKKELQSMEQSTLDILDYGIQNAIYYVEIPNEKSIQLNEIEVLGAVRFTDLGLKITNENQYFRIKGSKQMLVVKSQYVLKNEMINRNKN